MGRSDHALLFDLVNRLGLWLDEKRFDEARTVFTEDATADTAGGSVRGIDALAAQARRSHPPEVVTQHFITNPLIAVDGDRATIDANLLVVFAGPAQRRILGERYRLEAARTPDGWRLSRVAADPVWETAVA
ncbi:nuclear transport factor 2 family protein [Actinoallomurus rhizosphaericola]|uniref:nuclear transport factor 2 family protein n=1 Tax=Actinoallomurus rhizosphaericola TaxID=2952536 RepID=UPI002092E7E3|nr:nuclear transport factor 2 family protein [Actinoallomurus rhizosphaericola]MCO5995048.1 nuclear transport factor 2 family protein [Actinoallomurus rhizosphaericola]